MKDGIDIRTIKSIILNALQEIILVLIIDELQPPEIFIVLSILEIVDNQDVAASLTIEFLYDIAADETGTPCNNDHDFISSSLSIIHCKQIPKTNQ